jgi:hypothetical protein
MYQDKTKYSGALASHADVKGVNELKMGPR